MCKIDYAVFFFFKILAFLNFFIDEKIVEIFTISKIIQSITKHTKLVKQEIATVKNCGIKHFNICVIECPSILDGRTNKLIKQSGRKIIPFIFNFFDIVIMFNMLEMVKDSAEP